MKFLSNSRFTGPAILLLLLLNATLLVVLLCRQPETSFPPRGPNPEGPKRFLIEALQLDAKQQEQFSGFVTEHREAVEKIQHEIGTHRDAMIDQLAGAAPNDSLITLHARAIGDGQTQLEQVTMAHFEKLRAICRPEQQKKFDEAIREALRMMAPRPPHGPSH